jgi:hypothetical protein
MATPYGFDITLHHIAVGEQLTNGYGTFNIIAPFEPLGEGHPRQVVFIGDLALFYPQWMRRYKMSLFYKIMWFSIFSLLLPMTNILLHLKFFNSITSHYQVYSRL